MGGPTLQSFVYDDLYRLTQASGTFQYAPDKTHAYTLSMGYDTIHNITQKHQTHAITQPSGVSTPQHKTSYNWSYAYGASGPASVRPHAPLQIGPKTGGIGTIVGRTFAYDANGNQLGWTDDRNGTRRTIAWDDENRIQSLFDNGHEKAYKYDDQGGRMIKRGPQGETVYVNQWFTIRNKEIGTKHVYAGQSRVVSKLMKQDKPGANPKGATPYEKDLYFYHPDHLGSSSYVTDAQGKRYEHLEYFPFGETWVEESSNTQRTPYLFTSKELDEETGLYYFGARYYDPRTSVWQSVDPVLGDYLGGKPNNGVFSSKNLSLYSYVGHGPPIGVDPTGKFCTAVDETVTCTPNSGDLPTVSFPRPKNWPEKIAPGMDNYHEYRFDVDAGKGGANYTKRLQEGVANDPTPGNDRPATPEGTRNDAAISLVTQPDHVNSYRINLKNGDEVVVNVTTPDHVLEHGYVMRYVSRDKDGNHRIINYGEGNALAQRLFDPDNRKAGQTWIDQSNEIVRRAQGK
jgi:RHS repeat-associated protein